MRRKFLLQRRIDTLLKLYSTTIPLPIIRCQDVAASKTPLFLKLSSASVSCKHKFRLKRSTIYGLFLWVQLSVLAYQGKHSNSALLRGVFLTGVHSALLILAIGVYAKRDILVGLYNRLYYFQYKQRGKKTTKAKHTKCNYKYFSLHNPI